MKITVLMENSPGEDCRLAAEHGLSLYIETEKHRILAEYPQGTPVTVFDVIEDFAQIDICGWHCTINTKFLTTEKEAASAD